MNESNQPVDPRELLLNVSRQDKFKMLDKWSNGKNIQIKNLRLGPRGDLGEEYVEKLCETLGLAVVSAESRIGEHDSTIGGHLFEIKTATEDVHDNFQFNLIRTDYDYHFLFCLGIRPNDILFNVYKHEDVESMREGEYILDGCERSVLPGHMTGMAKSADVEDNLKLTKKPNELRRIEELQAVLTALFN